MQVLLWVAALSLLSAAAAMGVIAWRMARGARVKESARVELLKALAFPDASAAADTSAVLASSPLITNTNWTAGFLSEEETWPAADTFEPAPAIFGERKNPLTTVPRSWIALFAAGAAIVVAVMLHALAGGPEVVSANRPIELIALQSRFEKATAFDVSGLVRNPSEGRELPQLIAVVELMDASGRTLTSQTTPLERPGLEAGQTSAFSLVFPGLTGTVASYKVGFRLASGDAIPHIDRRASEPAAKTPAS